MENKGILIGVAIGGKYEHQADVMSKSFLEHNEGWDVKIFKGNEIDKIIPSKFRNDKPFNKSEIGRWCAIKKALEEGHENALYCDNDIFFYGHYDTHDHDFVLFPHYLSNKARQLTSHRIIFDGAPNLGMFEANGKGGIEICDIVINEVTSNPQVFYHKTMSNIIWTQSIASYLPYIGYDVAYDCNPAHNMSWWSLEYEDRKLEKVSNGIQVLFEGKHHELISFHFSGMNLLDNYGDEVKKLKEDYLKLLR